MHSIPESDKIVFVHQKEAKFDKILREIDAHQAICEAKVQEFKTAVKSHVASGNGALPNENIERIVREQVVLQQESDRLQQKLLDAIGISAAELEEIERAEDAGQLPAGDEVWHADILKTDPTEDLDDLIDTGLANLLRMVDKEWFREEATKPYRLGAEFRKKPLHLVNGARVGTAPEAPGPNRFARMLLLCEDHRNERDDLDFFAASSFLPEIAVLGNSLKEIAKLGPEAQRKLAALGTMADDAVTSTIFELLVGAACVRKGLSLSMVPETKSTKVPDFRINDFGPFDGAIECKRRLGLTKYELQEAQHVEFLWDSVRSDLRKGESFVSVEAVFSVEVETIDKDDFIEQVSKLVKGKADKTIQTGWGTLTFRRLHQFKTIVGTRLYSPDFLESAFKWKQDQDEWDGILCEVESPTQISVSSFRSPLCLKWRSESENAFLKKSRGIQSLWADAIKQIPAGDVGFIYVAYPEGSRPSLADARTQNIIKTMNEIYHPWSVRVPVSIVSRLYPRALGSGRPDLIENAMTLASKGQEFWLKRLPWMMFTHQLKENSE